MAGEDMLRLISGSFRPSRLRAAATSSFALAFNATTGRLHQEVYLMYNF